MKKEIDTEHDEFIETALREDYENRTEEYEELYAHKTESLSESDIKAVLEYKPTEYKKLYAHRTEKLLK